MTQRAKRWARHTLITLSLLSELGEVDGVFVTHCGGSVCSDVCRRANQLVFLRACAACVGVFFREKCDQNTRAQLGAMSFGMSVIRWQAVALLLGIGEAALSAGNRCAVATIKAAAAAGASRVLR